MKASTQEYVRFTQLWKGEQAILSTLAGSVPRNGTIVEIGTAEGGTALLMHRSTQGNGVKIYTVDVAPSPKAFEHLRDTGVTMFSQASLECARSWRQSTGRSIDLLFIDGSHKLEDVANDFNAWAPFVRPGGLVAFHDYDPVERGGLVHLGVKTCVDSLLQAGTLRSPTHQFKLLYGTMDKPDKASVDARACYDTLTSLARNIARIRDSSHNGARIVGDDRFVFLLQGCLKEGQGLQACEPAEVTDPAFSYIVSAHPSGLPLEVLRAKGVPDKNITIIDSVSACYLLASALRSNFSYLCEHTTSLRELLFWAETLSMYEHGFGALQFPDYVIERSADTDLAGVSQLVAREQVRLAILSRVLRTFVEWIP